jgi:hypothetical protein
LLSPISPGPIFSLFVVWPILLFDIRHRHSCTVYIRCAWCRRERCLSSSYTALLSYPFPLLQLPDTIPSD